jgi:uncharacterized protein
MELFIGVFIVFSIAVFGMAVGWIVSRKTIKGSCGGLANFRDKNRNSLCESCTNPSPECANDVSANQPEGEARV